MEEQTEEKTLPKKSPRANSIANLKAPWKPGQSGNPKGRPKGIKNFKTLFKLAAKEVAKKLGMGEEPDAVQIAIVKAGIQRGLKGNFSFYKDILDRLYGSSTQNVDVTSGGRPLPLLTNVRKDK